jgi:hypothetical protein
MSTRWRRRLLRLGSPLALVVTLTACGPHRSTTIGLRATVLDLQFARPDLAVPVPPTVIVRLLPAPPAALQHILNPGTPVPPPPPPPPLPAGCPSPSAPARPGAPLAQGTLGSPKPGYYSFATVGQGTVKGRTSSTSAKLPPETKVVVSASTQVPPGQTIAVEGGAPASGKETQYTVTTLLSPTVRQVDTLAVSATSLNLVKRQLTDGSRTFDVTPSPQVRLMVFGPVGTTWSSRGTDSGSGTTVDYAGSIDAVTQVKACGILTKAYVVTYQSTVTNTAGSEVVRDGTDKAHPSTFTIAPQLGGLVLATTVHSQDLRLYPDLRGYVGTNLDYTSTITDVQPTTS